MEAPRSVLLRCSVQGYDWGRVGEESRVARLFSRNANAEIEPGRAYAEFWMGTHESGPSFVAESPEPEPVTLKSWIEKNPSVLGEKVLERWGNDLPFLFKVLSVAKALSIQAHPDKTLAEKLHKVQPSIYKDSNHKPEIAIALTEFKALCGFVSIKELKDMLTMVPEIIELIGVEDRSKVLSLKVQDGSERVKPLLQSIFTKIMSASKEEVAKLVFKLTRRLNLEKQVRMLTEKEELVLLLQKQYPVDVGVISSFFLNFVKLNPGEALYVGPNEPHAYISGDCIECMATSDNVVRAGLTPKYRDVQALCAMLTYKMGSPDILQGTSLNNSVSRYTPPVDEFEVDHCLLPPRESVAFSASPGPSLFLVVAGGGSLQVVGSTVSEHMIFEGHVSFVPARLEVRLTAGAAGELRLYRAGVNSRFLGSRLKSKDPIP